MLVAKIEYAPLAAVETTACASTWLRSFRWSK
jgi:hypothetical protein